MNDTKIARSALTHFVKVEKKLDGGKKGYVIYWSDGKKWYRHGEPGHTPRVLRSTNRTIGILERKVSRFFPKAKIEMRSNRAGALTDDIGHLDVEVKPLPFVVVKEATVGKLRKDKEQLEAKLQIKEKQLKRCQTEVENFRRVFTTERVPLPRLRGETFTIGAVREHSGDLLGVAAAEDCEIVLTRTEWEKLIHNRVAIFGALHAYSADRFPVATSQPRLPSDEEPR